MSPKKKAPKMPLIRFSAPQGLVLRVLRLGSAIGLGDAGVHRLCWILGAMQVLELGNKISVSQKLEDRLQELESLIAATPSTELEIEEEEDE